jgi:hypothetical protein
MTLVEARESGWRVLFGERPMTRVAHAIEKGETQPFCASWSRATTRPRGVVARRRLRRGGASILELRHAKAPYTVMQRAMPIHPTVSERLPTILGSREPVA